MRFKPLGFVQYPLASGQTDKISRQHVGVNKNATIVVAGIL
jgi:hypothetical protein